MQRRSPENATGSGQESRKWFTWGGQTFTAPQLESGLYVVATPIGNLGDITIRALETLAGADRILCEDTRMTRRLTGHYGINGRMDAFHEHNAEKALPHVLEALKAGEAVALVSDAGTPLISDPGYRLVDAARAAGLPVFAIPGPSALTAALSVAGLATDAAFFAGFLPPKKGQRRARLQEIASIPATLVFYEAPHRLLDALRDMADVLGDRQAAVARELTKRFEEVTRGPIGDLIADYEAREAIKGEIVILVERAETAPPSEADVDSLLADALETASMRDAVAAVTEATGLPRKTVYARALALEKGGA